MNKRGQIYILAAIILSIAIFSVVKVTNSFISPIEDNFDFFVENFEGERAYVMNLGYLREDSDGTHYLKGTNFETGLLETFQDFGINAGLVLIEYDDTGSWIISNYLGDTEIVTDCDDCDEFSIPSATADAAEISFSISKGSKKWSAGPGASVNDFTGGYFQHTIDNKAFVVININDNGYRFDRPSKGGRVESLLFRTLGENYVKVVKV